MNNNFNLYNKYRPTSFNQLVGQPVIRQILTNSIKQKQINQAYIFAGPRGTGKTSLARILAKGINCSNFTNDVCNQCDNCVIIDQKQTTDIIELDAASNNGVDSIRDLISNAQYLPTNCLYKVYIIDEAHMLSNSAWNALLKIVEEPPAHVLFIFSTTEFDKIIPTIQSRCQKHHFFLLSQELISRQITQVAHQEGHEINQAAANKIAQLAQGSLRDGLSLLSQVIIYTNGPIQLTDVEKLLLLADQKLLISFLKSVFAGDLTTCLNIIQDVYFQGLKLEHFFSDMINIIIDLVVYKKSNKPQILQTINLQEAQSFPELPVNLEQYLLTLETTMEELKKIQNKLIIAKLGIIKLVQLFQPQNISSTTPKPITNISTNHDENDLIIDHKKTSDVKNIIVDQSQPPTISSNQNLTVDTKFVHNKDLFKTKTIDISQPQLAEKFNINTLSSAKATLAPSQSNPASQTLATSSLSLDDLIVHAILQANKKLTQKLTHNFIQQVNLLDPSAFTAKNLIKNKLLKFLIKLKKEKYLLICSEQVALISFETMVFALEFNNQFFNFASWHELNQLFKTNCYWVGIGIKQLKALMQKRSELQLQPINNYDYHPPEIGATYHKIIKLFHESSNNNKD